MSAEQKELEQNALASKLSSAWTDFKQGRLISYKMMALLLLLVAGIGLWWYISSEKRKAASQQWMELDEANSIQKLEEISKTAGAAPVGRLADLLVARSLLGPQGIDQLNATNPEVRTKAIENVKKAREMFGTLREQFKNDPVFYAESLLGLAKAEAALVGIPVKPDDLTKYEGEIPKLIEYLNQLSEAAAPDTAWATESKKLAEALTKDPADFTRIQRSLTTHQSPRLPGGPDMFSPTAPGGFPPN